MPLYVYKAKALGGKLQSGELMADTEVEARVKLRAQHLIPIKLNIKGEKKAGNFQIFKEKVKTKDLQVFTRQFATLINSGIPVVQSLDILKGSTSNLTLVQTIAGIKEKVEGGKKLADAIEAYPKVFDKLYINLVKAGEEGGVLDTILNRLAEYIEKSEKLRSKVKGAMWYPAGIVMVAFIVITAVMTYVIPKFEELFTGAGQSLPALTQVVVNLSHFMRDYWYLVFGSIGFMIYGFVFYYQTQKGKETIDTLLLKVPLFGPLVLKASIARFSRTLSTLLSCGVGVLDALEMSAFTSGNTVMEKSLLSAKNSISEGKSIVQPLTQNKHLPDMVVQMIGVGEQTGSLDQMLFKIADFYESEVEYAVGALTSMIEPILMVILGGIIAVLVVAMYLPMFNMGSAVGA